MVVGASAPTLRDVHATPVGGDELMAGPEVQANAIWTALHGRPLREPPAVVGLLLVALLALVGPLVGLRFPALAARIAVPAAAALFMVGAQLAFDGGLILDVVPPLVALVVGGVATIAWSQLAESRARLSSRATTSCSRRACASGPTELRQTQVEVLQRLGVAVEWRDAETGLHIERIGPLQRAPRPRGRHAARRTPSCCATRAPCTTSARSASRTRS